MDDQTPPTAADLGISEADYARLRRDLAARGHVVAGPAATGDPAAPTPPRRPASTRRKVWWGALAGSAVGLLLPLVGDDAPASGSFEPAYAFSHTNDAGEPVAYTSCKQIRVVVYPAGGPPDAEALVEDAVARVRQATGLDVVYGGAFGGHAPSWNFELGTTHPEDPISISWQDGAAIEEMTDHTAGLGGSPPFTHADGSRRLVAGTIALSSDYYEELTAEGEDAEARAVLLHELGHVFGLAHVDSPHELMHDENLALTDYGPGDLEGLRRLGRGPCY